jgi:hypothetical protein
MKALISTLEPRQTGYRVAEVVADNATFPVAAAMFWVDFPSEHDVNFVSEDKYWYDPIAQAIKLQPEVSAADDSLADNSKEISSTQELY